MYSVYIFTRLQTKLGVTKFKCIKVSMFCQKVVETVFIWHLVLELIWTWQFGFVYWEDSIFWQGLGIYMMTSSNGNIFRLTGPLWGESAGHRWIPLPKASDAELWFFFDLRLNKRLSKPSRRRWFEKPSRSLWRHCTAYRLAIWWQTRFGDHFTKQFPFVFVVNGRFLLFKSLQNVAYMHKIIVSL